MSGTSILPTHATLSNFHDIVAGTVQDKSSPGYVDAPFLRWYLNSMLVAGLAAFLTVMLGALAAYAFSRFRFKGRRVGMTSLLLIQMFPQFLAVVAIYLIVLNVGDIFGVIGLNTLPGLIIVYLGGALGVNAWLIKGFFDTIPAELDESARVDGATPSQIFWGVVLPLAAPVLAVVGLISFVFTLNEFVLASGAAPDLAPLHASGRHARVHRPAVRPALGAVRRRNGARRDPGRGLVLLPAALDRQRSDAGRRQGMSATQVRGEVVAPLAEPHHDGSDLFVLERPDEPGGRAVLRLRAPRARRTGRAALRPRRRARGLARDAGRADGDGDVVAGGVPRLEPARALPVDTSADGRWLNGRGSFAHEVPDADDFVLALDEGGPAWHLESVAYEIFPDRFAASAEHALPDWGVRRGWDELPTGRGPNTPRELFGGDLGGIEQRLDHIERLGASLLYLTPFFPARSHHRYDSTTFDRIDPLLGGDEALRSLLDAAHRRGIRVVGDLTPNHTGDAHEWFLAAQDDERARARLLPLRPGAAVRLRVVVRRPLAAEAELALPGAPPANGGRDPPLARRGPRRLADRRREHDRPLPRRRSDARGGRLDPRRRGRRADRRRARLRLPLRPAGRRLARRHELRRASCGRSGAGSATRRSP